MNYDLDYFIQEQKRGQIFAKMSKDHGGYGPGGSHYYVNGELSVRQNVELTFEPLEIALKYLEYGTRLTIIDFSENDNEIKGARYLELRSGFNKCIRTNRYRVKWVGSINTSETIDFIFNNIYDHKLFKDTLLDYEIYFFNKDTNFIGKAAKYFSLKAGEYLQEEPVPKDLSNIDIHCLNRNELFSFFSELQQKGINIYKRKVKYEHYTLIKWDNIDKLFEFNYKMPEGFIIGFQTKHYKKIIRCLLRNYEPSFLKRLGITKKIMKLTDTNYYDKCIID